MFERADGLKLTIDADTAPLRRELAEAGRLGNSFGSTLTRAFEGAAVRGQKLSDVVRSIAMSLSRTALSAALRPVGNAIAGGLSGAISNALGFARGGVLRNGMTVPFAQGGVIASPVAFPLSNGRLGLAGEAGPEAILPLARGSDGRLGVRSQQPGGAVSITFNVTTPDAESFRRSESQLAAMLARMASRGERNL
ncbi:MAG: phage tail tape measure protein [Hyphomicrobiales bacterium]